MKKIVRQSCVFVSHWSNFNLKFKSKTFMFCLWKQIRPAEIADAKYCTVSQNVHELTENYPEDNEIAQDGRSNHEAEQDCPANRCCCFHVERGIANPSATVSSIAADPIVESNCVFYVLPTGSAIVTIVGRWWHHFVAARPVMTFLHCVTHEDAWFESDTKLCLCSKCRSADAVDLLRLKFLNNRDFFTPSRVFHIH